MSDIDQELRQLEDAMPRIWDVAEKLGLDPFPVHFELVPSSIMYEFGAYGLPGRFAHWTHGKAFYRMKTQYDYGLSKIYELVINANPSFAFLMEGNSVLQNKLVIAHVLGHSDFFKHNVYFSHTNRSMVDSASLNAERIRRYEFLHGRNEVEHFLDAVLAIQEHIDPHLSFKRKNPAEAEQPSRAHASSGFEDLWELDDASAEHKTESLATASLRKAKVPAEPEKDLLMFLQQHAPELQDWQRDVIGIVHAEMLYFVPQMQTKIMNEGWASRTHALILRELDLTDDEIVEFANLNAGVVSPHKRSINPYHLGLKIFEDIERRWDNPTAAERERFGRKPGQGQAKLHEVRQMDNDVSFLRNYLTKELVEELDLYLYEREGNDWIIVEKDWEKVRDGLINQMTNFGNPTIMVEDGDYKRSRELLLKHYHEGTDLDLIYAEKTLQYIYQLWSRPVHLETVFEGQPTLLTYDGQKISRNTA